MEQAGVCFFLDHKQTDATGSKQANNQVWERTALIRGMVSRQTISGTVSSVGAQVLRPGHQLSSGLSSGLGADDF